MLKGWNEYKNWSCGVNLLFICEGNSMTTSFHYSCEQAKKTMQFLFVKKSCSTNILLLNLIFSLLFSHTNAVIKLPPNETIPAVLIFGDSIVDTGNNNNLITIGKCNYRPYGNDFKGQVSTGRYSNGKVPSDMIGSDDLSLLRNCFLFIF